LAVLSLGVRVLPGKVQKVRFCPTKEGDLSRSEVRANRIFLSKISNKATMRLTKVALRLFLINQIVCPIRHVVTPLNSCKVLIGNSYKVLQGKYKTTPILKNVCPG
jgi:hypothetical protein